MPIAVGVVTAVVLILTVRGQLYDTNFLYLSEVPSILAGDHPYRDFFEWGAPLAAYLSAAAQLLVGYRLIGEFALQWAFIIAGTTIAYTLSVRLSRSVGATLATMIVAWLVIAVTPTYHYPKLFFFPLLVWLGWRQMDAPSIGRSALFGMTTAIAFFFRHDFVAYFALAYVLASILARAINPASRTVRSIVNETLVAGAVATLVVVPWALIVQRNEGFLDYAKTRAAKYEETHGNVFAALLQLNPLRDLGPAPPPPPQPGVVAFFWKPELDETRQHQLEQQFGMRRLDDRDPQGRLQYSVPNIYDVGLLGLDPYINDGNRFQWERMREMQLPFPARATVEVWLEQMALLVPIGLLMSAAWQLVGSSLRSQPVPIDAWRMLFAATVLAAIDVTLLRQPSYVTLVAPLAAALSAPLVAGSLRHISTGTNRTGAARIAAAASTLVARALLLLTIYAAAVWAKNMPFFHPATLAAQTRIAFRALFNSPPVQGAPGFRYLYDCTSPGDHLLITGSTPFHVNYYAERPIAGGHLYWHSGWRSDAVHERESLALLERQSVPIAFSTHDPVLDDFAKYPRIREYLMTNYTAVDGTGHILVDKRRRPARRYGDPGLPCFRP